MAKKRKTKVKTKVVYRNRKPAIPTVDESSIKKEISELEAKKMQTGKSVRGVLKRMAIQKQIYDKAKYFKTKDRLATTRKATEMVKSQVELEEAKARLKEARGKSQVSFEGFGYPQQRKEIKIEDIFK